MNKDLQASKTPEQEELEQKMAEFAKLEQELSEWELDLATLNAELNIFRNQYLRTVGVKYARLDELRAKIAENLAKLHPEDTEAQENAEEAREQAEETAQTAEKAEEEPEAEDFRPSNSLKKLFRDIARKIHPDLAVYPDEKELRNSAMAKANAAYEAGDETGLRKILEEWKNNPDNIKGEGTASELVRIIRKIKLVKNRLLEIKQEIAGIKQNEIYQLKIKAEAAKKEGRDLLSELTAQLDEDIAKAEEELKSFSEMQQEEAKKKKPRRKDKNTSTRSAKENKKGLKEAEEHNRRGDAFYVKGFYKSAIQEYEEAIKLEPRSDWAHSGLGACYGKMHDKDNLLKEYKILKEINKDLAEELFNKFPDFINEGKETKLQGKTSPNDAVAWVKKGDAFKNLGKYKEAIDCFDKALEIDSKYTSAWWGKGTTLMSHGSKHEEAIDCFDKVIEIDPKDKYAWWCKGDELKELGKYEEAIYCYDKMLEIDPKSEYTWLRKGDVLMKFGKYEEVIYFYDKLLKMKPRCVFALWGKGDALIKLGKREEAISCYDKALKMRPKNVSAWMAKGCALIKLGKYEEAIYCLNKAKEINPRAVRDSPFDLYRLISEKEEYICFYDKLLEINPKDVSTWEDKGNALVGFGKHKESIYCFDKAIEIDPKDKWAWQRKGLALIKLGKNEEGIYCYDKAIEINPKNAAAWQDKGLVLIKLGKKEEGIYCYDKAIEIDPKNAWAWKNKGDTLKKLGKYEESIYCYDKAKALRPKIVF